MTCLASGTLAQYEEAPIPELAPDPVPEIREFTDDPENGSPARRLMYEGLVAAQEKRHAEAIEKLERVLQMDPSLTGAWETLGWSYWLTGRREDAVALWERLLALDPDEPLAYNLLAQVATIRADLNRARELYRKSLELDPDQFEIRLSAARVELWSGQREEAVRRLRKLLAEAPVRMDIRIDLAWALFANEQYEDSLKHWNVICDTLTGQNDYRIARARTLLYMGALHEARREAENILDEEPDNLKALTLLADLAENLALRSMRSETLSPDEASDSRDVKRPPGKERSGEEAVSVLRRLAEIPEKDTARAAVLRRLAVLLFRLHERYPEEYALSEVLDAAFEAMRNAPDYVDSRLFYGELLVRQHRYRRAEKIFTDVLRELNPHNLRARRALLEIYLASDRLDDAEQQLLKNLRDFNPYDPYRHAIWARIQFGRGNYAEAIRSLERLEKEGRNGAVFTLLYHGLSPTEWTEMMPARIFRDHVMGLRRAGFRFISPDRLREELENGSPAPAPRRSPGGFSRAMAQIRAELTGEQSASSEPTPAAPEMKVCITFDDGLRTSFRWATPVAEELGLTFGMHIPVGMMVSNNVNLVNWEELREYHQSGYWTLGSHLFDASLIAPVNREGHKANPLPNRLWKPGQQRMETLREYYLRIRNEFADSQRILARELGLEEKDIHVVAYPIGDIGQETECNIDAYNVPHALLNEAEIHYDTGFIQTDYGYAIRSDHPLLYGRYEPERNESAQEIIHAAYRNHPVFLARALRAEFAALQGEVHLALNTLDAMERDGYPPDLIRELRENIDRYIGKLLVLPDADMPEVDAPGAEDRTRAFVGIETVSTKANVVIDEWRAGVVAGLQPTPRLRIEARAGMGNLEQEVVLNNWREIERTEEETSRQRVETMDTHGNVTVEDQTITTYSTVVNTTNEQRKVDYEADETYVGVGAQYVFKNGSGLYGTLRLRQFATDEPRNRSLDGESALAYSLEYQWRPTPVLDMATRVQHDLVPSAREIIEYNSFALTAFWRVFDGWRARGSTEYAFFEDDNTLLRMEAENLWRLSARKNFWLGLRHRFISTDRKSDLYWTPYWEQRHLLIARIIRAYPNFYGTLQAQIGIQKERARDEDKQAFREMKTRADEEGWYPGSGPNEDWDAVVGVEAALRHTWKSGWEIGAEASVNALRDYTERTVTLSLLYPF